ncbi:MAG: GIY-YIG nuclease family protein [Pseudomonadales bacterium]|nr:GIY-YIG nuclease family protein [Pseudomonadales bacterium]
MKRWFIYLIKCGNGSLYTGITTDVARRLLEHQSDSSKSAKYLRGKGPLELVWQQEVDDKSTALRAELKIKKLSKADKVRLIKNQLSVQDLQINQRKRIRKDNN